jgi:hypothetical protein
MKRILVALMIGGVMSLGFVGCSEKSGSSTTIKKEDSGGSTTVKHTDEVSKTGDHKDNAPETTTTTTTTDGKAP